MECERARRTRGHSRRRFHAMLCYAMLCHATLCAVRSVCRGTRRTERENHVPISRISQYITCGPQEVGRPLLSALVATGASDPESEATAQPRGIVHTVLIGIHCRTSDLFRRLPGECRPMPRYLGVLAHYQILTWLSLPLQPSFGRPLLPLSLWQAPKFLRVRRWARGGSLIAKNACPRLIREARGYGSSSISIKLDGLVGLGVW